MARKPGNRNIKQQGGIMIVGEGITEWYYLQSIKALISSKVSPDVHQHKDGINYIEKTIKDCIDKGADTVICIIDMDNKQTGENAAKYKTFKDKYHNKNITGKTTKNKAQVILYENLPCIEMWFHYYFQYTTSNITTYTETEKKLRTFWADYEKSNKYYNSLQGGIHQYIVNKLKGNFNNALKNSEKSIQNQTEQNSGAYCQMKQLFDTILNDNTKKQLPIYTPQ